MFAACHFNHASPNWVLLVFVLPLTLHMCVIFQPRRARASLAQNLKESSSDDDEVQSVESEQTAPFTEDTDDDEDYT